MQTPIYITGVGIISSIGNNLEETKLSLLNHKSGIGKMTILPSAYAETMPVGEIKLTNEELGALANLAPNQNSRTTLLASIAVKEALDISGLKDADLKKAAFISATSVGGMDIGENFYSSLHLHEPIEDFNRIKVHDCGESTVKVAKQIGIKKYISTLSTACSSSTNAFIHASRLIQSGRHDIVIAGGSDALSRFTVNGFNSLMILSNEWCQPFDANRKGLNLGEAAAFLVLESEASVKARGVKPLGVLSGYGNSCDAYHQTASSPEGLGAIMSMRDALKVAGLSPNDIQYINMHGTATPNNDLSESVAVKTVFEGNVPPFSSTKSMTGHTLAASGSVEAVLSTLAINNGWILPNLNFKTPIQDTGLIPNTELTTGHNIKHILSNSFGFGGNNSSIILSAC